MADNNSVLTTVLVVVAVLLFTGNLTGNQVRNTPPGSQVAAWCEDPYSPGNVIAAGNFRVNTVEGNNVAIVTCDSTGDARIIFCPRQALALGANKAYSNIQDITTDPYNYGCRADLSQAHLSTIGAY